jgi:hypothetical protein
MMNHFLLIFLFLCSFQTDSVVEWLTPVDHDFGDLKLNVPATVDFRFKNTSEEAIIIDNVRSTCGCTASEWEEEAIAPGEEGLIKIEYDARKPGFFYKKITVFFSNQRKPEKLSISGFVE